MIISYTIINNFVINMQITTKLTESRKGDKQNSGVPYTLVKLAICYCSLHFATSPWTE